MKIPRRLLTDNEIDRLATLKRYAILDTTAEKSFDRIAGLAARLLKVPIAIVSLVDADRIWFKSHFGLEANEIPRFPGLCSSAILFDRPWIVNDALHDPRTIANPLVSGEFGLRFYAGVPLRTTDGHNLGTFCVIDKKPRNISNEEISLLQDLAGLVMNEMELRLATRRALHAELRVREQQISVDAAALVTEADTRRRFALDAAGIGDWDMDLRDQRTRRSLMHDRCFGYPDGAPAWSIGHLLDHVHADDKEMVEKKLAYARHAGSSFDVEFRVVWPDRTVHWLLSRGKFGVDSNGQAITMSGIYIEITDRKLNKKKLERLGLIVEKARTPVMITDALGEIEWANDAFASLTGYAMDEVVGKSPIEILQGPGTDTDTLDLIREAVRNQRGFEVEIQNYRKSGESFWQHIKADPIRDKKGNVESYIAVQSDITERKNLEMQLRKKANFDTLTGLPNRHLFWDRLDNAIRHAHRTGKKAVLFSINLDRFKETNDWFGHEAGDRLLNDAAARIVACVRESDTVARIGGDEFTVILTVVEDLACSATVAEQILFALSRPFMFEQSVMTLSASIGIAVYPSDAAASEDLLKYANQAMYEAKHSGRNQFSYFTQSIHEKVQRHLRLGMDLRQALVRDQLDIYFQPIVSLRSGRIVKAEALLRWNHDEGRIDPSEFVPLAEELGLIHDIGEWVFQEAALLADRWSKQYDTPFQISVNKSAMQFESNGKRRSWPAQLKEMGVPCKQISIEITEGVLLKDSRMVMETLLQYRQAGIEIALDDFGTGYSSMSYLSKFSIDYLKIDQSFVRDITTSNNRTIAETIILLGHKLGLKIIAEGIETAEQHRILMDAGCDFGQGFFFSQAVPRQEFEKLLMQSLAQ